MGDMDDPENHWPTVQSDLGIEEDHPEWRHLLTLCWHQIMKQEAEEKAAFYPWPQDFAIFHSEQPKDVATGQSIKDLLLRKGLSGMALEDLPVGWDRLDSLDQFLKNCTRILIIVSPHIKTCGFSKFACHEALMNHIMTYASHKVILVVREGDENLFLSSMKPLTFTPDERFVKKVIDNMGSTIMITKIERELEKRRFLRNLSTKKRESLNNLRTEYLQKKGHLDPSTLDMYAGQLGIFSGISSRLIESVNPHFTLVPNLPQTHINMSRVQTVNTVNTGITFNFNPPTDPTDSKCTIPQNVEEELQNMVKEHRAEERREAAYRSGLPLSLH
ncbi:uncharacterized protein LOC143021781 isoform X2 [Oratosquilla oratoria]